MEAFSKQGEASGDEVGEEAAEEAEDTELMVDTIDDAMEEEVNWSSSSVSGSQMGMHTACRPTRLVM
jgi:hypothetical protein